MPMFIFFLFAIETIFTYSNQILSTILFIYKILLNNLDNNKHKRYFSSSLPFKPTRATVSLKIFLSLCCQRRFNFPQRLIFHNTCCLCFVHLKRRYNFWIKNNSFKSLFHFKRTKKTRKMNLWNVKYIEQTIKESYNSSVNVWVEFLWVLKV